MLEKRFAREAGQPVKRDTRRAAQPAAPAQEEQNAKLQAQLREAQAAAEKYSATCTALKAATAASEAVIAEQKEAIDSLQTQLQDAQQQAEYTAQHLRAELAAELCAQLAAAKAAAEDREEDAGKLREAAEEAARKLAEASEAEDKLRAEAEGLRAELSQVRHAMDQAAASHAETEDKLRQQLRAELQEKIIQLNVSGSLLLKLLLKDSCTVGFRHDMLSCADCWGRQIYYE